MIILIIISCVYVFYRIKTHQNIDITTLVAAKSKRNDKLINTQLVGRNADYTKFVRSVARKKIFAQPVTRKKEDLKAKALLKARQQLKSLKLVGVLGTQEKRAIVEDTKTNSTLYAYLGDKLLNTFTVKKINSSTLTLEFEGTEFSLNL